MATRVGGTPDLLGEDERGKAINLLSEEDHDNFRRVLRDFAVMIDREERPTKATSFPCVLRSEPEASRVWDFRLTGVIVFLE